LLRKVNDWNKTLTYYNVMAIDWKQHNDVITGQHRISKPPPPMM